MSVRHIHINALIMVFCCSFHHLKLVKGNSPDRCSHAAFPLHTEHRGLCIGVYRFFVTWKYAQLLCEEEGTRLAKITLDMFQGFSGEAFAKFLFDKLLRHCGSVGLFFDKIAGEWKWIDGTDFDSRGIRPEARGQEDHNCMEICPIADGIDWYYQPTFCRKETGKPFLCQYDVTEYTTETKGQASTGVLTTPGASMLPFVKVTSKRTTPKNTDFPTETKKARNTVYRRQGKSVYPEGTSLWKKSTFTVSMCVRFCTTDNKCDKMAFHSRSGKCHGFSAKQRRHSNIEASEDWEVWVT